MTKKYFKPIFFLALMFAGFVFVSSIGATQTVKPVVQQNQQVSFDYPISTPTAGTCQ